MVVSLDRGGEDPGEQSSQNTKKGGQKTHGHFLLQSKGKSNPANRVTFGAKRGASAPRRGAQGEPGLRVCLVYGLATRESVLPDHVVAS